MKEGKLGKDNLYYTNMGIKKGWWREWDKMTDTSGNENLLIQL